MFGIIFFSLFYFTTFPFFDTFPHVKRTSYYNSKLSYYRSDAYSLAQRYQSYHKMIIDKTYGYFRSTAIQFNHLYWSLSWRLRSINFTKYWAVCLTLVGSFRTNLNFSWGVSCEKWSGLESLVSQASLKFSHIWHIKST